MSEEISPVVYKHGADPINGYATEKDEKHSEPYDAEVTKGHGIANIEEELVKDDLEVTVDDLAAMEEKLGLMSLDRCFRIMKQVYRMHEHDQNFPGKTLDRIQEFLADRDEIAADPDTHHEIVREMKLESLLVTENSPYAEVRAVVDVDDDYTMPCFTLRVWVLGIVFSGAGAFVNQLFSIRQPGVYVTSNVAQLLAYPFGRFMSQVLPDKGFHLFGTRHSLNPGPFNKKEHMLITIMATVAFNTPYTGYIVLTQALPVYFNQPYAYDFGYQILGSIGSNFVGYGLAGMCRRFLVFPSFCVWPTALVTIALNKAFHTETNEPVKGPFGRVFTMSRYKFFLIAFVSMFIYWWFPGFIFGALSYFNWLSWIAPNNTAFNNIVGSVNGLGVNPWPTFDFNQLTVYGFTPLVIPTFTIMNQLLGMVISFFMIVGIYWSNTWNTSYLPINSNHIFDNTGARFNVSNVLNDEGHLDSDKYQQYSQPYMAAGNLVCYFWFFAIYAATISYSFLYHRHEIALGFTSLGRAIKRKIGKTADDVDDLAEDVHYRLMKRYPEVPEWWYLIVLCLAAALGMIGVGVYPTYTTPATVIFGIIMALIFIIPVGLIYAVTGIQVTMNVLAEFIGGSFVQGNALAMNYFKMYGYITTAQAVYFSNDLKLAHYTKIPPRHTFVAQMVATVVSTFICTAVMNFQMGFRDVCTSEAAFGLSCPGENTFFTAAVFWGTFGPKKLFSGGGHYKALLVGFPVGFVLPFIMWGLTRTFPRQKWLRQLHPVMICGGGLLWSPYNFSYYWPTVIITYLSWGIVKKRYLAFWAKYNYVLAAAWMAAIAVAAIIIFFGLDIPGIEIDWWGNNVSYEGCEGSACVRLEVPEVGYFGPPPGTFN